MRDYLEFERCGRLLESHRWVYAKTMPQNPHHYTLRKEWNDQEFQWVVQYIRANGYKFRFGRSDYIQLDVNGHFYWTMGAPLDATILINRKTIAQAADYDALALRYDELFCGEAAKAEDGALFAALGNVDSDSVLDIGCGTGLFLDHATPRVYCGIDPSAEMLAQCRSKHPDANLIQTDLHRFSGERYSLVVALYGVGSYLSDEELKRIPQLLDDGGRYLIMFYGEKYKPATWQAGVQAQHKQLGRRQALAGATYKQFGNYWIGEGP